MAVVVEIDSSIEEELVAMAAMYSTIGNFDCHHIQMMFRVGNSAEGVLVLYIFAMVEHYSDY